MKRNIKLKENEKPSGIIYKKKKSDTDHSSPIDNKKITDFFLKRQENINKNQTTRSSKNLSSQQNNNENYDHLSEKSQRASSSFGLRREIQAENFNLKEEIRKLNKVMVDKESLIQDHQLKIRNLKQCIEISKENIEFSNNMKKVIIFFRNIAIFSNANLEFRNKGKTIDL